MTLLKSSEVAKLLRVSRNTFKEKFLDTGKIAFIDLDGTERGIRVPQDEVEKFIRANTKKIGAKPHEDQRKSSKARRVRLQID